MTAPIDRAAAEEFLFLEAQLLDERRYDEWLALFLPDAFYWVPARPDQPDPLDELSLIYDDLSLLQARVAQLRHPAHLANQPLVRSSRHISNVSVVAQADGLATVRSKLLMVEHRGIGQRLFDATVLHGLRRVDEGLRIASKTIMLTNADAPTEEIILPF